MQNRGLKAYPNNNGPARRHYLNVFSCLLKEPLAMDKSRIYQQKQRPRLNGRGVQAGMDCWSCHLFHSLFLLGRAYYMNNWYRLAKCYIQIAPVKAYFSAKSYWHFSYFSITTKIVGTHEVLLMSTHNVWFPGEINPACLEQWYNTAFYHESANIVFHCNIFHLFTLRSHTDRPEQSV